MHTNLFTSLHKHSRTIKHNSGLSTKVRSFGLRGTPFWIAPEVLRGDEPTTMSDVYAFGVTLFELLSRQEPYSGEDPMTVLSQVADDTLEPPKRPTIPSYVAPIFRDIILECLHKNPARRPSFQVRMQCTRQRSPLSSLLICLTSPSLSHLTSTHLPHTHIHRSSTTASPSWTRPC